MMLVGLPSMANVGNVTAVVPLNDGDPVTSWTDSSGNGHTATQSGSARPTFKTSIVNGEPVVRFSSASSTFLSITSPITGAAPWTSFVVCKPVSNAVDLPSIGEAAGLLYAMADGSDGNLYFRNRNHYAYVSPNPFYAAFHIYATLSNGTGIPVLYGDGTAQTSFSGPDSQPSANFSQICSTGGNGDIAELIQYNSDLGSTDRANVEKYLGTKYGITVAGGSAVQPDTVTGLVGWWKADSLG